MPSVSATSITLFQAEKMPQHLHFIGYKEHQLQFRENDGADEEEKK